MIRYIILFQSEAMPFGAICPVDDITFVTIFFDIKMKNLPVKRTYF